MSPLVRHCTAGRPAGQLRRSVLDKGLESNGAEVSAGIGVAMGLRRPLRGGSRWLTVGLTCLTTVLPLSIAACAEPAAVVGGSPSSSESGAPAAQAPTTSHVSESAIAAKIGQHITADTPVVVAGRSFEPAGFASFYQSRGNEPVWVTANGLTPRGTTLVADLNAIGGEGFDPRLYLPADLPGADASADDLARIELEISAGLVRYAEDARIGLSPPRRTDPNLSATEKVIDPTGVLLSAAVAPDMTPYIESLAPQDQVYRGLREALHRYQALEKSGAWQPLTAAMGLQPGAGNDHVRQLRRALVLMGDLPADADVQSANYGEDVTAAVRKFQRRHAIAASGAVDAATRNAYNVPPATRIRQIQVNMERRRWMPAELGADHILVNLPNYTLDVIEDGKSVLDMRVVIGKPTWPTPVFSDMMEYLEFNPYWTVPPGILKKEVLPKMRSNPGYASSAGLKVYQNGRPVDPASVDWSSAGRNFSFRQDPGERNALGRIKFMFPNQYSVYLHDTPSKALFARSTRAYSHGCVRVEKPMDLAIYLLGRNGDGWDRQRIDRAIRTGRNSSVRLKEPLPVHLAYFTVWLDSDGSVQFRNDIYGRDSTLERTLSASAG